MDEALHNNELLTRYLDGELSAGEAAAFEERLHTNKDLQVQLTQMQVAVQAINHYGTVEKVKSIHAEMMKELKAPQKGKVVSFSKTIRYAMAVAASILILFVGVRLYFSAQLSPEKIYNNSFVDFNVSTSRGSNAALSEIEKHYQQKMYGAVVADTRAANLDAKDSLLIGLAFLQQEKPAQAAGFFQRLAFTANDFQQDAEFYLSLTYLKMQNYKSALPLMQKIRHDPSHLYHDQLTDDAVEKVAKLNVQ